MEMEVTFFLNQATKLLLLYIIQYSCGLLVVNGKIKVNYTRKINHFFIFLIPIYLDRVFAYEETYGLFAIGTIASAAILLIYIKPIRERVPVIGIMFSSFDRPEDRPYTLLWLTTQVLAGFLVIAPLAILYALNDLLHLIMIPVLINGIGDGLAEPVGVRFGRHKYRVRAIFTNRWYYRTLEGSACVFVTTLAVIAAHQVYFTPLQLVLALTIYPAVMTLAEAFSPHTWDTPFLFAAGYLSLFGIMLV